MCRFVADIVVNSMLSVSNIGRCPKDGIIADSSGNVTFNNIEFTEAYKQSVEDVYEKLLQNCNESNNKKKYSGKAIDELIASDNTINEEIEEENTIRRLTTQTRMQGSEIPKGFAEQFKLLLNGNINWKNVIREMVTPEIKTRTNFSRPSRRSMTAHLQLPSMKKEGLDIVVAIDTSGSMSEEDVSKCIGELKGLFSAFDSGVVKVHLLLHTTNVYSESELTDKRELNDLNISSGGTSHLEVFEKAEELNGKALICFTDAMSIFPEMTTINNILWILPSEECSNNLPRYGKYIVIKNI